MEGKCHLLKCHEIEELNQVEKNKSCKQFRFLIIFQFGISTFVEAAAFKKYNSFPVDLFQLNLINGYKN
jgi:hypothetical protein